MERIDSVHTSITSAVMTEAETPVTVHDTVTSNPMHSTVQDDVASDAIEYDDVINDSTMDSTVHDDVTSDPTNPNVSSTSNSPSGFRTRVVSRVYAEPIFDRPNDYCDPIDTHFITKKRDLLRSKKSDCSYEKPAGDVRTLTVQLKKTEIKKTRRNDIR